jgi:hypothetical protein
MVALRSLTYPLDTPVWKLEAPRYAGQSGEDIRDKRLKF